jgi:opacity protein-like surface antigen
MKKAIVIAALMVFMVPGAIFADVVNFNIGFFFPRAGANNPDSLWQIEFDNMDFTKNNFNATNFGFSYEYFLTNNFSIMLGVDGYNRQRLGSYEGFVSEEIDGDLWAFDYGEGFPVTHVFSVSITPIQMSIKLAPLGRTGRFIPYVGGGIGLYLWTVRLQGEMIDFDDAELFYDPGIDEDVWGYFTYEVDAREENRLSVGYHAFAGFMIPIANRISLDLAVKYSLVSGSFQEGFTGFPDFDLGGYTFILGMNYWF